MELTTLLEYAAGYGIFAMLFVALGWYYLKDSNKREERLIDGNKARETQIRDDYSKREERLYIIIEKYADRLDVISSSLTHINSALEGIERRINGKS